MPKKISKYTRKVKRIMELKRKQIDTPLTFDEEAELERLLDYVEVMGKKDEEYGQ